MTCFPSFSFFEAQNVVTYRSQNNLTYPVNIARNVARSLAMTYFVFPSDIELYPSLNFIKGYLHNFLPIHDANLMNTQIP